MTGNGTASEADQTWYALIDEATGRIAGAIRRDGEVRSDDPAVVDRIHAAFQRELLTRNGEVIEELGVCYADVVTLAPDAPAHRDLVFRNLALLTGYFPGEPASS